MGTALPVPNVTSGAPSIGAWVDFGAAQNGPRTISLVSPAGNEGDQVLILGSNLSNHSDAFVIGSLRTIDGLAGGTDGQNPTLTAPQTAQYLVAVRLTIANPGSPNVVCGVGDPQPSGGSIANAIINGGQAGPIVAGTTDASTFTLEAGGIAQAVMNPNGNSVWGSNAGAATTTLQAGATGTVAIGAGVNPGYAQDGATGNTTIGTTTASSVTSVQAGAGGSVALGVGPTPGYVQTASGITLGSAATPMRINGTGVGINKAAGATALLDLSSTQTQGLRFPNMTSAQKGAIANTAGLVVFDTDLGKLCVNSGAGWETITSV
jgi:hypothetical protein